jgi:hypothetical protein
MEHIHAFSSVVKKKPIDAVTSRVDWAGVGKKASRSRDG